MLCKERWEARDCWPADAGTEDVDNRKALCPVKKADGRALAGSSRKECYWLTEGCVACTKKCMEEISGKAEDDIGRKIYKLSLSCRLV